MPSLFVPADRESLSVRMANLEATANRRWGRMEPAQMLAHLGVSLENAIGERPLRQLLLGRLVTPFIRGLVFGPKPFRRGSPTHPTYVVSDARDFEVERTRVATLIDRFVHKGPEAAARQTHPFFGRLDGAQWGILLAKHIDHHLRQFDV